MTWRYRTIDCVRHWFWVARPGPAEIVRATVPVCVRAGALAIPLALPGAAFAPAVVAPGPTLTGPAYEVGAVFAPGVYGVPAHEVPDLAELSVQSGQTYPYERDARRWGNAAGDESSPPFFAHTPAMTEIQPATSVPEPSSLAVLVAAVGAVVGWRRRSHA